MERRRLWMVVGGVLLMGILGVGGAAAKGPAPQAGDNGACLACHGNPELTYEFASGEEWSLYVDEAAFEGSVHGQQGLACTACHTGIKSYPHPALEVSSVRLYQLEQYRTCAQCHNDVYERSLDSVHAQQLAAGNWQAPVCTDCHGSHDVSQPDKPRTKIPRTCSKCHSAISEEYLTSVHGQALTEEGNADVPTCVDCHGVHNQEDPRTTQFRLNSPQLCARCHANEALMAKYGISTQVFQTYVSDFHGTTVTLFERQSPDMATNKPVCYDCHGVHDMKSPEDPSSSVYKTNLLGTCQRCHPDATENFEASWLSHYEPDINKYPVVYFVDLFYKVLIPAVIGFMGMYVVVDVGGSLVRRARRSGKPDEEEEAQDG
jgi:predicted CXXCH cytochrome family protein